MRVCVGVCRCLNVSVCASVCVQHCDLHKLSASQQLRSAAATSAPGCQPDSFNFDQLLHLQPVLDLCFCRDLAHTAEQTLVLPAVQKSGLHNWTLAGVNQTA